MIPPSLAASAATSAISAISSIAKAASSSGSDAADATTPTTSTGATKKNDTIGQTEFLSLLVAQLQHQDPLNPMDSADFSAQLAQFSSLEQLMQINQHLADQVKDPTTSTPTLDPVGLLGRDITAAGSTVAVSAGDASQLEYTLENAGKVSIEVHDAAGNLISSSELGELGAGSHTLDLDDVAPFANLGDGKYDVDVKVTAAGGEPTAVATRIRGTVSSVDLQSNPPVLRIGDLEIPLGDVREVSAPATA